MKKLLSIMILFSFFVFMPIVKADTFNSFYIRAGFSNSVNVAQISAIYVMVEVPEEEESREIELNNTNLFNVTLKDMPNSNVQFDSAYVKGDKVGRYVITGEITRNENTNTARLDIKVSLRDSTTSTTTTTTTTLPSVIENDDIIIVDDDGNVKPTSTTEPFETVVITTGNTSISQAAQNRLKLYKYIFIAVGILIAVVLFMLVVKVIRTSNLM